MYNHQIGYAGTEPGQKLDTLLLRLNKRDLTLLVGSPLIDLLPQQIVTDHATLCKVAERVIRQHGYSVFSSNEMRRTLLRNVDPGKRDELQARLQEAGFHIQNYGFDLPVVSTEAAWPIIKGFFGLSDVEVSSSVPIVPTERLPAHFPLFPHQRSVVRRAYPQLKEARRVVVHMPTGAGKTRTAMHLASRFLSEHEPGLVVWLASTKELLEQAADAFLNAWSVLGNREVELQRLWGTSSPPLDEFTDGLLVAGLSKLHALRQRDSAAFLRLAARTRLVIIDEAHQAIAPTYRELIDGLCAMGQAAPLLGLTATPGRTWNDIGQDQGLADFFGGEKVLLEIEGQADPVNYLIAQGYLARPIFKHLDYEVTQPLSEREMDQVRRSEEFPEELRERLAQDTARNRAIIQETNHLVDAGHRRILLFAASVSHAELLASALSAYGLETAVVTGNTNAAQRSSILRAFKREGGAPQVLCNFGVLTTGFDAPRTSAAIIARPTKSLVLYSQMVGRVTRGVKAGGNETCEILTVRDPSLPGFGDMAEAFLNWEDVWNDEN